MPTTTRFSFRQEASSGAANIVRPLGNRPALFSLMDQEPSRWRNGVVLIRIGISINNLGDARDLEQLAHDPRAAAVQEKIASCGAQRGRR